MRMPSQFSFPVDQPSLEPTLGSFYQDFSPALELVEEGYHGPMDAEGVPLVDLGAAGCHYNAIIVAQYALANFLSARHGSPLHTQCLRQQVNWLVRSQEQSGRQAGFWLRISTTRSTGRCGRRGCLRSRRAMRSRRCSERMRS